VVPEPPGPAPTAASGAARCVTAAQAPSSSGLSIREQVSAAVGSLLDGDFTLPASNLTQKMQSKVPALSPREAEVALATAAAAVRRVHAFHQDLNTLREAGDHSRVGSVLATLLVYLNEGPQWSPSSPAPDRGSSLTSPQPILLEDRVHC